MNENLVNKGLIVKFRDINGFVIIEHVHCTQPKLALNLHLICTKKGKLGLKYGTF